jgi:recombinational DNA repair protein RecR
LPSVCKRRSGETSARLCASTRAGKRAHSVASERSSSIIVATIGAYAAAFFVTAKLSPLTSLRWQSTIHE